MTILAVLLGLLVAADFGLAAIAEHTVSQKAREQLGLTADPSVTVHGFPFATQAISGDYDHISVRASGVRVQELRDLGIQAELRHVSAPLSDLLSGNVQNVVIGKVEGQIRIKEGDIAKVDPLTKVQNLRIEPSTEKYVREGEDAKTEKNGEGEGVTSGEEKDAEEEDSQAGVRLSGDVQIAGEKMEIFAFAMIELDGTSVRIEPRRLQFGNDKQTTVVPPAVQDALLPNFQANINAGDLPFTVTPTAVEVESGAVVLKGEAENVTFTGASAGG